MLRSRLSQQLDTDAVKKSMRSEYCSTLSSIRSLMENQTCEEQLIARDEVSRVLMVDLCSEPSIGQRVHWGVRKATPFRPVDIRVSLLNIVCKTNSYK